MVTEKNLTVLKCIKWKCSQNMPVFSFTGYNTVKLCDIQRQYLHIHTLHMEIFISKNENECCELSDVFTSRENWVTGMGETHILLCTLLYFLNFVMYRCITYLKNNF